MFKIGLRLVLHLFPPNRLKVLFDFEGAGELHGGRKCMLVARKQAGAKKVWVGTRK